MDGVLGSLSHVKMKTCARADEMGRSTLHKSQNSQLFITHNEPAGEDGSISSRLTRETIQEVDTMGNPQRVNNNLQHRRTRQHLHTKYPVFGCVESNYPRRIYKAGDWKVFRKAYNDLLHTMGNPPYRSNKIGFDIDYEVREHPTRGRSIYALQDIPKDTKIWQSHRQEISFARPRELVTFLNFLPSMDLRCEVMLWAYVFRQKVYVAMDDGNFFNHGNSDHEINVDKHSFASRDIHAGEELLMNYTEFIEYNSLPWFDDLRSHAWRDPTTNGGNNYIYESTNEYNLLGTPNTKVRLESFEILLLSEQRTWRFVLFSWIVVLMAVRSLSNLLKRRKKGIVKTT